MKIVKNSKPIVCLLACVAASLFFSTSNQAVAQITYTITGTANNFTGGDPDNLLSPEVGPEETYTAVFEIDDSVADTDPLPEKGLYSGAIISSSIEFSGGYTSGVDFSGGTVTVSQDGSVGLSSPGAILVPSRFTLFTTNSFESDALLTDPQEIADLPGSLWSLTEPDGLLVVSFALPFVPPAVSKMVVSKTEILLGDCNLDGVVNFNDISPFIELLSTDSFLAQADTNQSGEVDFDDIAMFITILASE